MRINTRNSQRSVSTGDQTFCYTTKGVLLCFAYWLLGLCREISIRLFLRDVENQKFIDIPRFLSVLHSDLLNKV